MDPPETAWYGVAVEGIVSRAGLPGFKPDLCHVM